MEKKHTIVRNIAIGVVVGAAVAMLNKENRNKLTENVRKARLKASQMRESVDLKERVQNVGIKGSKLADLNAMKEKMIELAKWTPAVVETVKESRDIFNKKKQEVKDREVEAAAEQEAAEETVVTKEAAQVEEIVEAETTVVTEPVLEAEAEAAASEEVAEEPKNEAAEEKDEQKQSV